MAEYLVACPKCEKQYRLKAAPAPGVKMTCRSCGAVFTKNGLPADPTTAATALRASDRRNNWPLIASLSGAAVLLVVCSVLATLLLMRGEEQVAALAEANPQPAAKIAVAQPAQSAAPTTPRPAAAPPDKQSQSPAMAAEATESPPEEAFAEAGQSEAEPSEPPAAAVQADPPPAVAQSPPATKPNPAGPPRYQWRKGDVHAYKFEVSADLGDEIEKITGSCQLEISAWEDEKPKPPVGRLDLPDEIDAPAYSGSAFVIHPDGYLATCAHVVEGGKTVKLHLKDHEYTAEVIAVDPQDDIALLKVKARNLKPLPLANSDAVQLGEDIRVLGYPLSDLLGSNLKVSRGIVAGEIMEAGSKRFQIDAAVNPGNSGGPVVNDRGEVVGVTASMISGSGVSPMAFAVPANSLRGMLAEQKLAPPASNAKQPVDGAALVSRASASMALVEVIAGEERPTDGRTVLYRASYQSQRSSQDGNRIGFSRPIHQDFGNNDGALILDDNGALLETRGDFSVPFSLGAMRGLMVEPLDAAGKNFWKHEDTGAFTYREDSPGFGRAIGPPIGSRFATPFMRPPSLMPSPFSVEKSIEAKQRFDYRIVERRKDLIILEKTYSLVAPGDGKTAALTIEGSGKLTFDQSRGCVTAMDYRQTIKRNIDNVSVSLPVHISFARQNAKDFVAERLPLAVQSARRESRIKPSTGAEEGAAAESRIDDLLRSIQRQLADDALVIPEIHELGNLDVVPSRQAKVAKLLMTIAASGSRGDEHSALSALEKWADESCVTALIKLVESGDDHTANQAAEILGNIGDARAAVPIAQAMTNSRFGGFQYAEALKKLGPAAEAEVLPLLKHRDDNLRREACEILAEIGGERSAKALRAGLVAASDDDLSLDRFSIERALEEIRRRGSSRAALAELGGGKPLDLRRRNISQGSSLDRAREVLADRGASDNEVQSALQEVARVTPPNEATRKEVSALIARRLSERNDEYIRSLALRALAKWGGPEHETDLLAELRDEERAASREVYEALGRAGGERSAKLLLEQLKKHKHNRFLAPAIADALGAATPPGPVQVEILKLLDSEEVVLRAMAARALGAMETDQAPVALERFLKKEDTTMALVEAVQALARHKAAD